MTLQLAIIADDLTGALDTGTPFVEAGLQVAVAVDMDGISDTIATGADIVVINTASRALSPQAAAERVTAACQQLLPHAPPILFKKIDSRLKGNVAAETAALASATGRARLLVAPAIPDQQRFTRQSMVVGHGIDTPIAIAPVFAGLQADVADCDSQAGLDRLVLGQDWTTTLAVGARGLGLALARSLTPTAGKVPSRPRSFQPQRNTVLAFGSRDPVTLAQYAALEQSGLLALRLLAPGGRVPPCPAPAMPLLVTCSGPLEDNAVTVADRFAASLLPLLDSSRPDMLMMGGGDTALAILRRLGARVLLPQGEIEPGIPWFALLLENRRKLLCAVKSGGFGNPQSLLKVINPTGHPAP